VERGCDVASPQIEDGYTPIANEIVEALWRVNLSAYETRVLWYLFRKTYGWQKKSDMIALSQFEKSIGVDRRLVHRAIQSLRSKNMVVIYIDDRNHVSYGFQKDYDEWVINGLSSKEMMKVSSVEMNTKETRKKEKKETCKRLFFDFVYLTEDEHTKLVEKYGKRQADDYIEAINLVIGQKGEAAFNRKYASHYFTLLNWIRRGFIQSTIEPERKREVVL
jgi:phage replication O-like protein O